MEHESQKNWMVGQDTHLLLLLHLQETYYSFAAAVDWDDAAFYSLIWVTSHCLLAAVAASLLACYCHPTDWAACIGRAREQVVPD